MSRKTYIQSEQKITEGLKKSFAKLVAQKKKENGVLVFSEMGKIIKVKAKDIRL